MSLRSLRWQIQLWHAALLSLLVAAVLVAFYGYERRSLVSRIDAELTGPLIALLPQVLPLPGAPAASRRQAFVGSLESSGHYIIVRPSRADRADYTTADAPPLLPVPDDTGASRMLGRWNGANRELVNFSPRGDLVILGRRAANIDAELRAFALKLAGLGAALVSFGLLGGHLITSRAIRPLRAIGEAARRVADGGWHERIPADRAPAEVEDLRSVLNASFDRIAATYEQQRRFTADASHELGTPVSVILAKTQHALSRPRSAEDYAEALRTCRRAAERMQALHTALLDLASLDAASSPRRRVECHLSEIAREALALVTPRAEELGSRIHSDLAAVPARVDPLGVGQVLVNLLNNALTHNAAGVSISVLLRHEGDEAVFTVADTGTGIPDDALPHLFDRFYRADAARTRAAGGSGLGLSIAHAIVRLHGGSITAANQPSGGALFTVRLPAPAAPQP